MVYDLAVFSFKHRSIMCLELPVCNVRIACLVYRYDFHNRNRIVHCPILLDHFRRNQHPMSGHGK